MQLHYKLYYKYTRFGIIFNFSGVIDYSSVVQSNVEFSFDSIIFFFVFHHVDWNVIDYY